MPPKSTSQSRSKSTEKPAVQPKQLKSGVQVWYPPGLYGDKSSSATAAATSSTSSPKSSAKDPKRTTRAASSSSSSSGTRTRLKRTKKESDDDDEEPVEIPQIRVVTPRKPPTTPQKPSGSPGSSASLGSQTLKSGVTVWYPPSLYAKKSSQSPGHGTFPETPTRVAATEEEDFGTARGDAAGWTVKLNSSTGRKYYYNTKTDTTTFRKPAGFADPEDEEVELPPPKKNISGRKEMFGIGRRVSPLPTATFSRSIITKKPSFPKFVVPGVRFVDEDDDVEMHDLTSERDDEEDMEVDAVDAVRNLRDHQEYSPQYIPNYRIPTFNVSDAGTRHEAFDLVLDTNIFLSLEGGRFLVSFALNELTALPPVRIRIPHVVFVELDRLKMRKGLEIAEMAMQAVRFLNDNIAERRDARFIGQTAAEYSRGHPGFRAEMNDDRVLIYCLQLMDLHEHTGKVICVTDDKNLQNRATVNGITAISGSRLYQEVGKNSRNQQSMFNEPRASAGAGFIERVRTSLGFGGHASSSRPPEHVSPPPVFPGFQGLSTDHLSSAGGSPSFHVARGLPVVVCDEVRRCVEIVLTRLLAAVLEVRFRQVYDDHWLDIVKVRPPWTSLQVVLGLIQNHWIAVFGDIFTADDKANFSSFTVFLRTNSSARGSEQVADHMLQHGSNVVAAVEELDARTRSPYEHLVHSSALLLNRWRDMFDRARKGLQPADMLANECAEFLRNNRLA